LTKAPAETRISDCLENPDHPRENAALIAGADWVHGQQAALIWRLRAAPAKKRTRRERFLAEMEKVVPWKALIDLIEPHYHKTSSKGGRPPYPLKTMLRIHLLQQWYELSDPAMEDALIEVPTMRRFAGIDIISDRIPDETTIIDATLIAAPSSTKNKDGERDPEMHQTKKGNQWYFGMKVQIGVDSENGLIHSVETTAANVHDLTPASER